jgi:hypothetical protein
MILPARRLPASLSRALFLSNRDPECQQEGTVPSGGTYHLQSRDLAQQLAAERQLNPPRSEGNWLPHRCPSSTSAAAKRSRTPALAATRCAWRRSSFTCLARATSSRPATNDGSLTSRSHPARARYCARTPVSAWALSSWRCCPRKLPTPRRSPGPTTPITSRRPLAVRLSNVPKPSQMR